MSTAILLISCPDRKGITAKVTNFVYENQGNIEHADQHIDFQTNTFFMRIEWCLEGFIVTPESISERFQPLAQEFKMDWRLYFSQEVPRLAIFTSRQTHCLHDLLLRHQEGQFNCQIPLIVSNHPEARKVADYFGIEFVESPKTAADKQDVEKEEIRLLREAGVELIVLARYMQIFTKEFVNEFSNRIINIHHSFLPAFVGRNPYEQAYRRGVKLIGASSHYVTEKLDAGAIIEQDTVRISHRDSLDDLRRKGRDLEKVVLGRAVRWHLERKILVYNNKTVIFD